MSVLDARDTRPAEGGASFSLANRLTRLAWIVCWTLLARWTPRPFNGWRCWLARRFGARIEPGATIYGSATIWLPAHLTLGRGSTIANGATIYNQGPITIGRDTIISQRAHLCSGTHDHRDPLFQLVVRPINVGDRVWIAAEAFVGPGVTVADGTVLAARGCLFKNSEPWTVYSGNPAVPIGARELRAG